MVLKSSLTSSKISAIPARFWLFLYSFFWLLLLCWLAFFNNMGSLGLMDKTEALFVEIGNQMLKRGDWITPWWNGKPFFDYPVWGFWMVALSFQLFGVSEWSARLPVALAASSVVVAAFALLMLWPPPEEDFKKKLSRALIASGIMATTPGWIGWGRTSTTDMFLSSAISLALFGFLLAHRHFNNLSLENIGRFGLALFTGIAVLAKGPVGVVVPALVIASFLTITSQWRRWLRPVPVIGMLMLFLAVCLPWYAAATKVNGMDFLWGFLGFSNIQRFTSVIYNHPGPPWFYIPWTIVLLLPWSLFLPVAMGPYQFWKLERWRPVSFQQGSRLRVADPLPLFLLLWFLIPLALFSAAATKLAGYILPALPPCSLLVALYWRPLPDTLNSYLSEPSSYQGAWPIRLTGWFNIMLFALMAAAAVMAPKWVANDPAYPDFSLALNRSGLPLTLSFLLALTAIGLIVVMLRRSWGWLWIPNLAGFMAVLALVIAPLAPLLDRERQLPLRTLAIQAQKAAFPFEPLWVVGTKRYSTIFYSGLPAVFVYSREAIDDRLRVAPASLSLENETTSVLLLGDRNTLKSLHLLEECVEVLNRQGELALWRVPIAGFQRP